MVSTAKTSIGNTVPKLNRDKTRLFSLSSVRPSGSDAGVGNSVPSPAVAISRFSTHSAARRLGPVEFSNSGRGSIATS